MGIYKKYKISTSSNYKRKSPFDRQLPNAHLDAHQSVITCKWSYIRHLVYLVNYNTFVSFSIQITMTSLPQNKRYIMVAN